MIEKLKTLEDDEIDTSIGAVNTRFQDTELVRKINELIDAVNELQKDYDNVCVWVGEQKLKAPAENVQDKFAEQRKWIGCLVEYGNADDGFRYGILTNIEPRYSAYPFEIDNGRDATADCWLPSKTIFYKGDK